MFTLTHKVPLPSGRALAIARGGTTVIAAQYDGALRVWDAATLEERRALSAGKAPRVAIVAPDGARLVAGNKTLTSWSTETWKKAGSFKGHKREVGCAAFAPDGKTLWAGGRSNVAPSDTSVRAWDVATGAEKLRCLADGGDKEGLAFSPDGARLAVRTAACEVVLLDAATGDVVWRTPDTRVFALAFTPKGRLVGTSDVDLLCELDTATGERRSLAPPVRFGAALAISSDGATAFVASAADGAAVLTAVDLATGSAATCCEIGPARPVAMAITPDDRRLFLVAWAYDQLLVFDRA